MLLVIRLSNVVTSHIHQSLLHTEFAIGIPHCKLPDSSCVDSPLTTITDDHEYCLLHGIPSQYNSKAPRVGLYQWLRNSIGCPNSSFKATVEAGFVCCIGLPLLISSGC